jgi:hypothetical protein
MRSRWRISWFSRTSSRNSGDDDDEEEEDDDDDDDDDCPSPPSAAEQSGVAISTILLFSTRRTAREISEWTIATAASICVGILEKGEFGG